MAKLQGRKEVAKHPHMGSREESFGSDPGPTSVAGGTMAKFGYKAGDANTVWPPAPTGPDVKTGYPRDYQKSTKKAY